MDLQKGKGRPGLPGLKLGGAPPQGQVQQHLTWLETGKDESYGHATYCYDWGGNYFRLDKVLDLLDRLFQRQSLCQVPSHGRRGIFVEHVVNLFSIDICKTSIRSLARKVRNGKWVNLFFSKEDIDHPAKGRPQSAPQSSCRRRKPPQSYRWYKGIAISI